jgi:hypothetical protein
MGIGYKKDPLASKLLKHFTLARAVMDRLSGWRLDKPRNKVMVSPPVDGKVLFHIYRSDDPEPIIMGIRNLKPLH